MNKKPVIIKGKRDKGKRDRQEKRKKRQYSREKRLEFKTEEQELRIRNLPGLKKGLYDIIVEVHDLNTGKNDIAIEDVRIR